MNLLTSLLVCILFTSTGQLVLKKGMLMIDSIEISSLNLFAMLFNPYVFLGITFNLGGWAFYMLALSKSELSFAYPIWSLTFVIVPLVSLLVFNESVSFMKLSGLGFVFIGVCLIAISHLF